MKVIDLLRDGFESFPMEDESGYIAHPKGLDGLECVYIFASIYKEGFLVDMVGETTCLGSALQGFNIMYSEEEDKKPIIVFFKRLKSADLRQFVLNKYKDISDLQ